MSRVGSHQPGDCCNSFHEKTKHGFPYVVVISCSSCFVLVAGAGWFSGVSGK